MEQLGHDVFITGDPHDAAWIDRIADDLGRRDVSVFNARRDLGVQQSWADQIQEALEQTRNLIVLWSDAARASKPVRGEIEHWNQLRSERAGDINHERGGMIVVALEGDDLPPTFGPTLQLTHVRDFDWYRQGMESVHPEAWNGLIESITRGLQRSQPRRPTKGDAGQSASRAAESTQEAYPPSALDSFALLQPVQDITRIAGQLASSSDPPSPITTMFLLLAIVSRGEAGAGGFWAADWLAARLGAEGMKRVVGTYIEQKRTRVRWSGSGAFVFSAEPSQPAGFTAGAMRALERARELAQQTSHAERIHTRHLLAALLLEPEQEADSVVAVLSANDFAVNDLREAYYGWVRGYGDDDDAWGALLFGEQRAGTQLTGFDPDDSRGEDFLGVRPDVLAFAGLIAARSLAPPLSIGLFGEWGSGKTFFMRMLQKEVARLAREAREASQQHQLRQRDQLFYRRIIQIEFNAWHYVEGNLWASLVQHILDNLRVIDDRKRRASDELQEPILRKLGVEKQAEVEAERERVQAEVRRDAARDELATARTQFDNKARELARISGENFLADLPLPAVKQAIAPALARLGVKEVTDNALALRATIAEARALVTRGNAAVVPLLHGADRQRRWLHLLLALLAGPVAALLAGALMYALGARGIATLSAVASGVSAALAAGTAWLKRQLLTVGDVVNQLESAQKTLDETIAKAQAENEKNVREAEGQLRLLEADYIAAKRKEEEANKRVAEAEARVAEASVARLMTSFIEDRANSNDYRKHLGVLALVRNDFERLSDLIADENERLSAAAGNPRAFPDLAAELKDEPNRINRIVLYIDDLDRCPPAKVVEVLQAVHLLLAFPLFVVVVGVDARWLVRSLGVRYRELLRTTSNDDGAELSEFDEMFGAASAHDYVEKIFQVPFWLSPMGDEDTRRMVHGLLQASQVPSVSAPGEKPQDGGAATPAAPSTEQTATLASAATASAPAPTPHEAAQVVQPQETPATEARQETDLAPESLDISAPEVAFMKALAPLLGRSPRTLKRFINVYRLIKVGLSPYERRVFLNDAAAVPDYRAVLMLLAVDTGAPAVAPFVFSVLRDLAWARILGPKQKGEQRPLAPTLDNFIAQLDEDPTYENQADWLRIKSWLQYGPEQYRLPNDISSLARWVPHVSRFSFHTGRI